MTEFVPPVSARDVITVTPAEGAEGAVTYHLKPPTGRTRSAVQRDVMAEGIALKDNAALLEAILEEPDLDDGARRFIDEVRAYLPKLGVIHEDDWPHVRDIAGVSPAAARIIADRVHHGNLFRLHMLRHHLVVKGARNPLSEDVIDVIPVEEQFALWAKLDEMTTPSKAVAKNCDAP